MFYIKESLPEGGEVKAFINSENVFTVCPRCGKEHAVDLTEVFDNGKAGFYGTQIYCPECAEGLQAVLHHDKAVWLEGEAEYEPIMRELMSNYLGMLDCCGEGEESAEAKALLLGALTKGVAAHEDDIIGYFTDMYHAVGGSPEEHYADYPEIVRLIRKFVQPEEE